MIVPLITSGQPIGTLNVQSRRKNAYDFQDEQILLQVASLVASTLENQRLFEQTQNALQETEILSDLGRDLLISDTLDSIYTLTLDAVAATNPSRGAAIFVYDQLGEGVDLELAAIWDNPAKKWPLLKPGSHFSAVELGLDPLVKSGKTVKADQVTGNEEFSAELRQLLGLMRIESLVAVPIRFDQQVNGFILIGHATQTPFSANIIHLYENIARQTSVAVENRRLFEQAEHRATLLQTAAEVSQVATSYLELDTLLPQMVDLIRDRFDYYHASIFFVDKYNKYATVEASTGEIGRQMLTQKHRLEVGGKSIVGTATKTGQPRIALDVGKDAIHFNNPLLPETRSEMALPLISRGRVIGALDVQSKKRGAFATTDIVILQSMANQLANAIEAARFAAESQNSLEDVRKLHERYLRTQWRDFLHEQSLTAGYRLTEEGFVTLSDSSLRTIDTELFVDSAQPVLVPSNNLLSNDDNNAPTSLADHPDNTSGSTIDDATTLLAPLSLQNEMIIGTFDFDIPDKEKLLEEDTLEIVEAVTAQAAQAVEAARLFEQTQAAREEAEALYKVGRALVSAETEVEMYHTVLTEMLTTLGLEQGGILFFEEDKAFGTLVALFEKGQSVEPGLRIPIKENPSYERMIETKRPVAIEDTATDPLVAIVREINLGRNVASILLVPIVLNDEVIGAMGADSVGKNHKFTEWEISLASAMADQLSLLLQNRRLLEETRRRAILLQTSSDVGQVATAILDQDTMLDQAVDLIRDRFGFYQVQIFLVDESRKSVILNKSTGEIGRQLLELDHKVTIGSKDVIGQATAQRKSLAAHYINEDDGAVPEIHRTLLPDAQSELAIPLQVGGGLLGVLDVQSTAPDTFTSEEISTLEALGSQLAIAIQNARAFREQQETAERLKEIDKLKTQFLANMSHELRTPLNSIIGFSRVILKGIDGPLTELQKTDLTSIHNSGQHLLGLINNILDLSKIEAGKMELHIEEIEAAPIIKSVMATALALVKDKNVELIQEVPDNLPILHADPTRVRQVILNLVSNACKFTEEGAVTLIASVDKRNLIISVTDTGIGIPEDAIAGIFEEFTQVDASTTRKAGGTGLGLPISRHFVEMHKGKIWVNSIPGRGSTFSFSIPLQLNEEMDETIIELSPDRTYDYNKVILAIDSDENV
ncbi:MAG: GAF domain-containing protein, partial [Chloroflexota bacterium]